MVRVLVPVLCVLPCWLRVRLLILIVTPVCPDSGYKSSSAARPDTTQTLEWKKQRSLHHGTPLAGLLNRGMQRNHILKGKAREAD
ncbi:hypothetical protein Y1Q_0021330 [Alligator mississippiensis]|uniref:Secreted protein n=1 Tax=Alligator mississippiensis TaxID=8496 RepID=A0A151PA61_ALLMI|nr:hypothetical protein Y1Q_0021330 [Alligator mississippiensis]